MKKRAQGRGSRSSQEEHRAQMTQAGGGPELPPEVGLIAWLLQDPAAREALRRQLIDGKAGAIEPLLWELAYSGLLEQEEDRPRSIRFITREQFFREMAAKSGLSTAADHSKAEDCENE